MFNANPSPKRAPPSLRPAQVAAFRTGLIDAILAAQQASPSDPEVQLRACNALVRRKSNAVWRGNLLTQASSKPRELLTIQKQRSVQLNLLSACPYIRSSQGTMSADPEAGARALQKGAMESVVFYSIQPHTDVLEIVQVRKYNNASNSLESWRLFLVLCYSFERARRSSSAHSAQAASIAIHWMFSAAPEDARVRAKGLSLLPQLAILLTRYYKKASFAVPCLRIMSEVMDTDNALWEAVECGLGKLAPQVAEAHRQDAAVHVVRAAC